MLACSQPPTPTSCATVTVFHACIDCADRGVSVSVKFTMTKKVVVVVCIEFCQRLEKMCTEDYDIIKMVYGENAIEPKKASTVPHMLILEGQTVTRNY